MFPTRNILAALALAAATALPVSAQNIVTMVDGEVTVGDAAAFNDIMARMGNDAPNVARIGNDQIAAMPAMPQMPGLDALQGDGPDPMAIACATMPQACPSGAPEVIAAVEVEVEPCEPVRGFRAFLAALFGLAPTPSGCDLR